MIRTQTRNNVARGAMSPSTLIVIGIVILVVVGVAFYFMTAKDRDKTTTAAVTTADPTNADPTTNDPNTSSSVSGGVVASNNSSSNKKSLEGTEIVITNGTNGPVVHYDFCTIYNSPIQPHGTSTRKCFDMDWMGWLDNGTSGTGAGAQPLQDADSCWGNACNSYCGGNVFKGPTPGCHYCTPETISVPEGVKAKAWQMNGSHWNWDSGACTIEGWADPGAQVLIPGDITTLTNNTNCAFDFELEPGYYCPPTPTTVTPNS